MRADLDQNRSRRPPPGGMNSRSIQLATFAFVAALLVALAVLLLLGFLG